jgi:hypothetical protein
VAPVSVGVATMLLITGVVLLAVSAFAPELEKAKLPIRRAAAAPKSKISRGLKLFIVFMVIRVNGKDAKYILICLKKIRLILNRTRGK